MKNKLILIQFFNLTAFPQFIIFYKSLLKYYRKDEFELYIGITKDLEIYETFFDKISVKYKYIDNFVPNHEEKLVIHVPRISVARLYMFDIFPELKKMKNLLYIDTDTIFNGRINKKMFSCDKNIAITDKTKRSDNVRVAKWIAWHLKDYKKISDYNVKKLENNEYFNAGVIFINDKNSLELQFKQAIKIIVESGYHIDDQNALNYLTDNKTFLVLQSSEYNCQPWKRFITPKTKIIHFASSNKPWNYKMISRWYDPFLSIPRKKFEKLNKQIKTLILEENSQQIKPFKNHILNKSYSYRFFSKIKLSKDCHFEKIKPSLKRKEIYSIGRISKNSKIINKFDIVIGQSYFVHYDPGFVKKPDGPTVIEFFHGTLVKDLMHLDYNENKVDYFLSPNLYMTEALKTLHYPEDKIIKLGYPRMELYRNISGDFSLNKNTQYNNNFKKILGKNFCQNFVIFVPSWIFFKNISGEKINYNLNEILNSLNENEKLLVSPHPNQIKMNNVVYSWDEKYNGKVIINSIDFPQTPTYSLMFSSYVKKAITDFSSAIFDFANVRGFQNSAYYNPILDKNQEPLLIEEYKKEYSGYGSLVKEYKISNFSKNLENDEKYFKYYNIDNEAKKSEVIELEKFIEKIAFDKWIKLNMDDIIK